MMMMMMEIGGTLLLLLLLWRCVPLIDDEMDRNRNRLFARWQ